MTEKSGGGSRQGAAGASAGVAAVVVCQTLFFVNDTAATEIYTLALHDAIPILAIPNGYPARWSCLLFTASGVSLFSGILIFLRVFYGNATSEIRDGAK